MQLIDQKLPTPAVGSSLARELVNAPAVDDARQELAPDHELFLQPLSDCLTQCLHVVVRSEVCESRVSLVLLRLLCPRRQAQKRGAAARSHAAARLFDEYIYTFSKLRSVARFKNALAHPKQPRSARLGFGRLAQANLGQETRSMKEHVTETNYTADT